MRGYSFTLIEAIVVGVVIMCVAAVTLPAISRIPRRIEVENALTGLRQAFTETSMRARATGVPLTLSLDVDEGVFVVERLEVDPPPAAVMWKPPVQDDAERSMKLSAAISSNSSYDLPSGIDWELELDDDLVYVFYEDGQASGPSIRLLVGKRAYVLRVDALNGNAIIEEEE